MCTHALLLCVLRAAPALAQERYVERVPGTVVSFEMVPVPGGTVEVGGTPVEVEPFWIARTETTWDLYDVFVYELDRDAPRDTAVDAVARPTRPYVLPGDDFGHAGMPALGMTMHAARAFALWLSARTGRTYRVPTEAQWEHACRIAAAAGTAWTADNAEGRTRAAGSSSPDAHDVFDMRGNVAEWVAGFDGDSVVKGGSFDRPAAEADCASRRSQTSAWNATDPQLPKSRWWLPDAVFVGLRLIRISADPTDTGESS